MKVSQNLIKPIIFENNKAKNSFASSISFSSSLSFKIKGAESETAQKLNSAISREEEAGAFKTSPITKESDKALLKKILKDTQLPQDGEGIKISPDEQRMLGLYFKSIPAVLSSKKSFLINLNSKYIFASEHSINDKSVIYPIPLSPKDSFGQDARMVGQTYRHGNLSESERVEHLQDYTKSGRHKIGKEIETISPDSLGFKIPEVTGRPLKTTFLSIYPEGQDYAFQSIGPNYIESYLKDNLPEGSVDISHLETALDYPANIKAKLSKTNPDIIGISTKTNSHQQLKYWMEYLEKEYPDTLKVIGGQLANSSYKELLSDYPNSLIIFDNGEVPFKKIADIALGNEQPENLGKIPNLAFNLDGNQAITQFEDFNWIAAKHVKPSDSNIKEVLDKDGVVAIRLSQGCWGNCTFCTHPGKWHGAKIDEVIDVLKDWKEKFGLKGIFFTDDEIVNKDPKEAYSRLEELSDKLAEANLGITWTTALRADCVNWMDEDLINKMKKAGCVSMFLGIESGSDTQLLRYGKPSAGVPVNADINKRAIELFAKHGMKVGVGWIPFDPLMPTLRELRENIDFIEDNNLLDQNIRLDTSLRVQRGSSYGRILGNKGQGLLGELQPNMFHYDAKYLDPRVGTIKDHTREWIDSMGELDGKIHAIKFQLAVDPSKKEEYQPIVDIGKKLQCLTLDYMKALAGIFEETPEDRILDGVVSADEKTRSEAKAMLNDRSFMSERSKNLQNQVVAKRDVLLATTQEFTRKRSEILDEYQKINHSTTKVTRHGPHMETKTTRCTGLPTEWEYANRTNTAKGENDDVIVVAPYFEKDGKKYLVFIETERPPVLAEHGIRTIEFPAGLVNAELHETTEQAVDRNISDEIGYEVLNLEKLTEKCASTPGITSETSSFYLAKIGDKITDRLKGNGVIKNTFTVPLEDSMKFLREQGQKGLHATAQTYAALSFIYEKIMNDEKF